MDILLPVLCALLGSILASFIGVVAERIGTGEGFVAGRSRCNSCGEELAPRDLVPIASWISSGGRAACCGARLPVGYVLAEVALAVSFYFAALVIGVGPLLPLFLLSLSVLLFIVLYDIRHTVVPIESAVLLVLISASIAHLSAPSMSALALSLIVAGAIGLGFFLLYALSGGRFMGLGDSPVALALSLMVGTAALPGLVFSFWIGALYGVAVLVGRPKGHRMGIEVPFVPFLALGFLLAYFTQWTPFIF